MWDKDIPVSAPAGSTAQHVGDMDTKRGESSLCIYGGLWAPIATIEHAWDLVMNSMATGVHDH